MPKSSSAYDKEDRVLKALRSLPGSTGTIADIHRMAADGTVVETFYRPIRRLLEKKLIHKVGFDYRRNADLYGPIEVQSAAGQLSLFDVEVDREQVASEKFADSLNFGEDIVGQNAAYTARSFLYEENRRSVLTKVFELWRKEDPRELILRYIDWLVEQFRQVSERYNVAFAGADKDKLRRNADRIANDILEFANRGLGIHYSPLRAETPLRGIYTVTYDRDAVRLHLEHMVFGEHMIDEIQLTPQQMDEAKNDMVVVGTDSSMHIGEINMGLSSYAEDEHMPLTVNNGAAFWNYGKHIIPSEADKNPRDMLPWDAKQMEGPPNEYTKYMIVGPEVLENEGEDKYVRIAVSASEIVQRHMDEQSIKHPSRRIPDIVFHDGRIYPMEHKLNNYLASGEYGNTVRSAIRHFYNILVQITGRKRKSPLYTGVVKSTELKIFSRLLDWYIRYGTTESRPDGHRLGEGWPETPPFPDTSAMTYLLSLGGYKPETGVFFTTCQIQRNFSTLAGYYQYYSKDGKPITDWEGYFQEMRRRYAEIQMPGDPLPPILEYDMAPFVELCDRAGVLMFFINHTQNSTDAPRLPRYEIFCDMSEPDGMDPVRVRRQVERVLQGLMLSGVQADKDHNLAASIAASGKQDAIMIPNVLYEAHETAKVVGKDFEAQFRAAVFSRIIQTLKAQPSQLDIIPASRHTQRVFGLLESPRSPRVPEIPTSVDRDVSDEDVPK